MMSDEDSRDSGICEMDYASMPTSFSDFGGFKTIPMEIDMQELDEMETTLCEELMQVTDEAEEPDRIRKQLSNITSIFSNQTNLSNQKCDIRRFESSSTALFDESPKSRTLFARPSGLCVRSQNTSVTTKTTTISQVQFSRKRTFGGFEQPSKRVRQYDDENHQLVASTSNSSKPLPSISRVLKQNGSSALHRAASSSVLERGESYAKSHNGDFPHLVETRYNLTTISPSCSNAFRRITAATLHELLSSMADEEFRRKFVLVDCRYPYEFDGGHVKNAINIYDPAECEKIFYNSDGTKKDDRVPIFYCEYSQKRGPSMAHCLRRLDRQINELKYPHVDYQEMYVLDKGFRNFYLFTRKEQITTMCQPDNYITMDDSRFTCELKKWSFHKKSVVGTSVRVVESRSRHMLRQLSADSHFSPATSAAGRVSSRRPLFVDKSPSSYGLSTVPELRTPSPPFEKLVQPHFS